MIRRKLTRIEVTLDDTKELDDFFSKTPQIGQLTSNNPNSSSNSKLSNLNYQKQLLFLSKKYELNQTNDSSTLDPTSSIAANSNAANSTINTVVGDTQTANQTSNNLNESESRFLYNPQPYNPSSSRFNQDN